MRLKLWHKFAFLLIFTSSAILLVSFYFSQQSFTRGFFEYLNAQEDERTDYLVERLMEDYARYESWSFVSGNPQDWHQYIDDTFRQARKEGLFPELKPENNSASARSLPEQTRFHPTPAEDTELFQQPNAPVNPGIPNPQRGPDQSQFQPPPHPNGRQSPRLRNPRPQDRPMLQARPGNRRLPPPHQLDNRQHRSWEPPNNQNRAMPPARTGDQGFQPPPHPYESSFQPFGPPGGINQSLPAGVPGDGQFLPSPVKPPEGPRPLLKVALEDRYGQLVAGALDQNREFSRIPLRLGNEVVGQLLVKNIDQFSSKAEKEFVHQQNRIFSQIAGLTIILIGLLAWFLGRSFNMRIDPLSKMAHQLAAGNFEEKTNITSHDELGQLSQDLNQLAYTLEQNRDARQRWIADISHELRTPIAVLQGELEALLDGIRPLKIEAIASLKSEVSRLTQLVEDLYQLSMADVGALSYEFEQINLVEILKNSLKVSAQQFKSQGISIRIKLQTKQKLYISGDKIRLEQLFKNLIQNTLRYTDSPGKLQISVFQVKRGANQSVVLHWSDSAPGVPPELCEKLFNRMVRGEGSRNRKTGGAGLGLAIVKQVVSAHRGKIRAENSPLGGLTFKMHFPRSRHYP